MLPPRLNFMYIPRTVVTQTLQIKSLRTHLTSISNRYGAVVFLCLSTQVTRQRHNWMFFFGLMQPVLWENREYYGCNSCSIQQNCLLVIILFSPILWLVDKIWIRWWSSRALTRECAQPCSTVWMPVRLSLCGASPTSSQPTTHRYIMLSPLIIIITPGF